MVLSKFSLPFQPALQATLWWYRTIYGKTDSIVADSLNPSTGPFI